MPRYALTLAYDGSDFCGWQKQEPLALTPPPDPPATTTTSSSPPLPDAPADPAPAPSDPTAPGPIAKAAYSAATPMIESTRPGRVALRTVQGVLERAVREVTREPIELVGASRTDSGVHARAQVAAFTCSPTVQGTPIPGGSPHTGWPADRGSDRLLAAINSRLPDDVVVRRVALAPTDFDPVADVVAKGYSYTLHVSRARPLWDRHRVHHLWRDTPLNVDDMSRAAQALLGEHDFASFAALGHGRLTTVRTLFSCSVHQVPLSPDDDAHHAGPSWPPSSAHANTPPRHEPVQRVRIDVSGSGFLWNMVRIIVGTLMQVGIGQRPPEDLARVLAARDRTQAGPTAPPTGLCLEWIRYQHDPFAPR